MFLNEVPYVKFAALFLMEIKKAFEYWILLYEMG